jgi:hypothetical protein
MAVSDAKREANRLNAQKSTGPRTEAGKAVSSRNAITHGVFCRDLLVLDESEAELMELKQSALQRMDPRDGVELQLVEQWVGECWKLKRLQAAERSVFEELAKRIQRNNEVDRKVYNKSESEQVHPDAISVTRRLIMDGTLEKYQRYQQRLLNNMLRCGRELRSLRKEEERRGDQELPNEATIDLGTVVQNEAKLPEPFIVQNEATDSPKSKAELSLPAVHLPTPSPQAAKLNAAVTAALPKIPDLTLRSAK